MSNYYYNNTHPPWVAASSQKYWQGSTYQSSMIYWKEGKKEW